MALQLGALRDALIDAGAAPDKAERAAEELAGYERTFGDIRTDLADLRAEMRAGFADLRGELKTSNAGLRGELDGLRGELKTTNRMLAVAFTLVAGVLLSQFALWQRLGDLGAQIARVGH